MLKKPPIEMSYPNEYNVMIGQLWITSVKLVL